mgnify:CR=1 FL=1
MLNNVAFGQLYPVKSFVHKMDARVKLLLSILYIVTIMFVNSYFGYVLTAFVVLSVIFMARVPLLAAIKTVKPIIFIVLLTALLNLFMNKEGKVLCSWWIFTITDVSLDVAIKMSLRLFLLVLGSTLLTMTTSPMDLTDGIERMLKPLKAIKVPVSDIAIVMSIALRFIPTLLEETDKIIMAQKARGSSIDEGGLIKRCKALIPILIPLFVSAFRKSDELALALDSRCYKSGGQKTKMKVLKVGWRDLVGSLFMIAYMVVVMLDTYLWMGLF